MDEHEVYPGAPAVLVALELRHPRPAPLDEPQQLAIKSLLASTVPIMREAQALTVQMTPGITTAPDASIERFPKFVNRDTTVAVSMRQSAIVVESSGYAGWSDFRLLVELAFQARQKIAPVDGVERIGLRYIDEIRVPDNGEDWSRWLNESLLAPKSTEPIALPISQWQGVAVYGEQPGFAVVLRYGPRVGFAVDPNADLRRLEPVDDPTHSFFLMDIDSFWTPDGTTPEFEVDHLLNICGELHAPARALFEGLITDTLRNEVLRK